MKKKLRKKLVSAARGSRGFRKRAAAGGGTVCTLADVRLVSPQKGPTSVSLAKIREAVRHVHDAQKST
jgi:hypothetical protein